MSDVEITPNLTNARGRRGRLSFLKISLMLWIPYVIIMFGLSYVIGYTIQQGESTALQITMGISIFAAGFLTTICGVLSYITCIQRFHDINRSGWWAVLMLIPGVNLLVWLYLVFAFGTRGPNRYSVTE